LNKQLKTENQSSEENWESINKDLLKIKQEAEQEELYISKISQE